MIKLYTYYVEEGSGEKSKENSIYYLAYSFYYAIIYLNKYRLFLL